MARRWSTAGGGIADPGIGDIVGGRDAFGETLEGQLQLIGKAALIKNKRSTGRIKDLADVERLTGST